MSSKDTKYVCECGCVVKNEKYNVAKHKRTEKHLIMMRNGGDLKGYQDAVFAKMFVADLTRKRDKSEEGSSSHKVVTDWLRGMTRLDEPYQNYLKWTNVET